MPAASGGQALPTEAPGPPDAVGIASAALLTKYADYLRACAAGEDTGSFLSLKQRLKSEPALRGQLQAQLQQQQSSYPASDESATASLADRRQLATVVISVEEEQPSDLSPEWHAYRRMPAQRAARAGRKATGVGPGNYSKAVRGTAPERQMFDVLCAIFSPDESAQAQELASLLHSADYIPNLLRHELKVVTTFKEAQLFLDPAGQATSRTLPQVYLSLKGGLRLRACACVFRSSMMSGRWCASPPGRVSHAACRSQMWCSSLTARWTPPWGMYSQLVQAFTWLTASGAQRRRDIL